MKKGQRDSSKLIVGLHIHTIASGHGFSTIQEIAKVAALKGLKLIAITDHGPNLPGGLCSGRR